MIGASRLASNQEGGLAFEESGQEVSEVRLELGIAPDRFAAIGAAGRSSHARKVRGLADGTYVRLMVRYT
jgi:hypothetical protein